MFYLMALGSNRSEDHLSSYDILSYAIWLLGGRDMKVAAESRFLVAPAVPQGVGPDYLRVAVAAHSDLDPPQVAAALRQVEIALTGEAPSGDAEAGDVLVTDLLACGDQVLPNPFDFRRRVQNPAVLAEELVLPHPALHASPTFLTLLRDIAPDWKHPVFGQTVREMLAALPADAFDGIAADDGARDERDAAE